MTKTIGSLLLDRLPHLGLNHIFGIPGDYILTLYKLVEESPLSSILGRRARMVPALRPMRMRAYGELVESVCPICGWTKYRQCRRLCLC